MSRCDLATHMLAVRAAGSSVGLPATRPLGCRQQSVLLQCTDQSPAGWELLPQFLGGSLSLFGTECLAQVDQFLSRLAVAVRGLFLHELLNAGEQLVGMSRDVGHLFAMRLLLGEQCRLGITRFDHFRRFTQVAERS